MSSMTSTNKWPVFTSQTGLSVISFVSGKVAPGDAWTILNYLCERYNAEVETIRKDWSWGYAYRPVRGKSSGFSNHASGTAVDLNALSHPMWARNTFSASETAAVRRILADIGYGVIKWGQDYKIRADGMHFELNLPPGDSRVKAAAARIRAINSPGLPAAPAKPSESALRPFSLGNVVNSRARRTQHPNIAILQRELNKHYLQHGQGRLAVDGWWGPNMERVFNAYRRNVMKLTKVSEYTGAPGIVSVQHLLAGIYKVV